MLLKFNDGKSCEVQSVSASDGVMLIRLLGQTSDALKAIFGDEFAVSVLSYASNTKKPVVHKGYTKLIRITEYIGGIWEVELRKEGADDAARIASLEEQTTELQLALADIFEMMEGL